MADNPGVSIKSHEDASRYLRGDTPTSPRLARNSSGLAVIDDSCPVKFRFARERAIPATMAISCNARFRRRAILPPLNRAEASMTHNHSSPSSFPSHSTHPVTGKAYASRLYFVPGFRCRSCSYGLSARHSLRAHPRRRSVFARCLRTTKRQRIGDAIQGNHDQW